MRSWLLRLVALTFAVLAASCNATPPVPPAELPGLIFPRSVRIDTEKIQSHENTAAALVGAGGTFSNVIAAGADLSDGANAVLEGILSDFRSLLIPLSASTTTFEADLPASNGGFNVKIDFADYDFDGDGTDDGCSGHTAALPVCLRVWLDGERFLAGKFTQYATEDNPGAGEFRGGFNGNLSAAGEDIRFASIYDHFDPEDKTTALFLLGTQTFDETLPPFTSAHIELFQEGPDATARKTINANADTGESASSTDHLEYLGRYLENANFWGGSVFARTSAGETGAFDDLCAVISTGEEATGLDANACEARDIDVGGLAFTDPASASDVELPDDFPSAPTF